MTNVMYNLPLLSQYLPKKEGRDRGCLFEGGECFFQILAERKGAYSKEVLI